MERRVVRVTVPTVTEYDVVFEEGRPLFVGAVIPREASATGPDAGKVVDTHRTTWDGRDGREAIFRHPQTGEPLGLHSRVIRQAQLLLASDPSLGLDRKAPNQLGRPFKYVQKGRR